MSVLLARITIGSSHNCSTSWKYISTVVYPAQQLTWTGRQLSVRETVYRTVPERYKRYPHHYIAASRRVATGVRRGQDKQGTTSQRYLELSRAHNARHTDYEYSTANLSADLISYNPPPCINDRTLGITTHPATVDSAGCPLLFAATCH